MRIGVVVGKFQTPYLTDSHQRLIKWALDESDQVIIFLLTKRIEFSENNPLAYRVREAMLLNHFKSSDSEKAKNVKIQAIYEQKYASKFNEELDVRLKKTYGDTSEFIIFGGHDEFTEAYKGLCQVRKKEFMAGMKSEHLRAYCKDLTDFNSDSVGGMLHSVSYKPITCYNYVVSLGRTRGGLVVIKPPDMHLLCFPTVELRKQHTSMLEASYENLYSLIPEATISRGHHYISVRVDDWRFRQSDDFCYYHIICHEITGGNLQNVEILRPPFNAELMESEYLPIINTLNSYK